MDNPKDHSDQPEKSSTQKPQNAGDEQSNVVPISRSEAVAPTLVVTIEATGTVPPRSSSIAPPARVLQGRSGGGGGDVTAGGGGSGEGSRKRRWRINDPGASGSGGGGGQRPRRRVDAGVPAVCAVCSRSFPSFYALFGHLRSHNNREWGGAFPPPAYNPDWVQRGTGDSQQQSPAATQKVMEQEVIPALLDAAQETLAKMNQGEQIAPSTTSREVLELDLNVQPQEGESAGPSSAVPETTVLDLNLPPPKEDDEDAPAP
ncbi:hypothetical protein P3X46_029092 [Hevea brasiliensis]|uniref:C2H2-type domain-containing protein n=1 Tax=Hevea brasiliensis TaxID=3981 RepID=A0ABQ9KSD3_HEVBR|nr:uncharacterized protein LOC110662257 [Hevea brasiliensis]KAJ9146877.1 hypothetical protein P3X46_029092 [Hevea brasiliensis]